MRDGLIALIDKSGMVEGRIRCEIIADELIANGALLIDIDVVAPENRPLIQTIADMPINEALELIKAKQEGRLILPPCKVGDIVYTVGVNTGQSIEAKVLAIGIDEYGLYLLLTSGLSVSVEQQLGKTVFLTKEEAEKCLKEKGNERVLL